MAEVDALPQSTESDDLATVGTADLIVGIPTFNNSQTIGEIVEAVVAGLARIAGSRRVAVVQADGGSKDDTPQRFRNALADRVPLVQLRYPMYPLHKLSMPISGVPGRAEALDTIFGASQKLGATGGAIVESDLRSVTADWIDRLLSPLSEGYDLVWPLYVRQKFEGAMNNGIVYPFTRALYGRNIRFPVGSDFGFSTRVAALALASGGNNGDRANSSSVALVARAIQSDLQICEARLGPRVVEPRESGGPDVSSTLAQALTPVFGEAEKSAPFWQRIKTVQEVPMFGAPMEAPSTATPQVNIGRMIESYRLGHQDLQAIWGRILPPATLVELKRLSRMPEESFRLADEIWARIIYDFALGYRLRTLARDHLLRALTPLYLAWVASFIGEVQSASADQVEARIERLCTTFETQKRYFISRWRWPDRFNP